MITLKEATAEKHRQAERMAFNIRMASGNMSKAEYLMYLYQQLAIFEALEVGDLPHEDLRRSDKIKSDISELLHEGYSKSELTFGTTSYVQYLNSLSEDERLPHIYLNYLAQMFGGQMMKKVVPSQGKMYDFDNMRDAMLAIRQIQRDEWADEVNKGFEFHIKIFADLEEACQVLKIV